MDSRSQVRCAFVVLGVSVPHGVVSARRFADGAVGLARRAGDLVHLAEAYTAVANTAIRQTLASGDSSVFEFMALQHGAEGSGKRARRVVGKRKEALAKIERLLFVATEVLRLVSIGADTVCVQGASKGYFREGSTPRQSRGRARPLGPASSANWALERGSGQSGSCALHCSKGE